MKLRLRSMDARGGGGGAETHRLGVPATATLDDVKALLAAMLASPLPVPAESIRLSLNRTDELLSPEPSSPLPSLGLASGDLLFFSLSPLPSRSPPQTLPRNPNPKPPSVAKEEGSLKSPGEASTSLPRPEILGQNPGTAPPEVVMAEAVGATRGSASFVVRALKREMEAEKAAVSEGSIACRLVVAVHAALLDAGLLAASPSGSRLRLPQGWDSAVSTMLSIKYTVPEFVGVVTEANEGKVAVLNCSMVGKFVTMYGYLPGTDSVLHRLCLDSSKLAPLLYLDGDQVSGAAEREILELWRVFKDKLCLPLMFWLCLQNRLPLPPCLMTLLPDLKAKILEFVPGLDLARVECTCRELRGLAADDNLWKKKYEEEFKSHVEGSHGGRNRSWKQRFANAWAVKMAANNKRLRRPSPRLWNYGWRHNLPSPHGFPMIGGDMDMLPDIGNPRSLGISRGNQRRDVSPSCLFPVSP